MGLVLSATLIAQLVQAHLAHNVQAAIQMIIYKLRQQLVTLHALIVAIIISMSIVQINALLAMQIARPVLGRMPHNV